MDETKSGDARGDTWQQKSKEYELKKTRTKLALNICTICGADKAKACQGCGTTAYCSTDCQRIDWRDRGHRKVCKKIQAAEAARAEAPTPPPSRARTRSVPARVPSVVYRAQRTMRSCSLSFAATWRTRCRKRFRFWERRTPAVTTAS